MRLWAAAKSIKGSNTLKNLQKAGDVMSCAAAAAAAAAAAVAATMCAVVTVDTCLYLTALISVLQRLETRLLFCFLAMCVSSSSCSQNM